MITQQLNELYHCVYNLKYHLVLVTKYRRRCLTEPVRERLKEIFSENARKWDCELLELNGEEDHVHLLLSLTPKVQLTTFANNMKTVSSRLIRKEFAEHIDRFYIKPVLWSRSYCILTCGGAPLEIIRQYIEQQGTLEPKPRKRRTSPPPKR